ncbi:MAG: hypothetical protein HYV95_00890 [Opitutae bacterium]|nr:hypothetical protein [Opitutae bacterium]
MTPAPYSKRRSVGAVLAGFVVILIFSTAIDVGLHLTAVFPPPGQAMSDGLWLLAISYRLVLGVVGSYVAARLTPARPMPHALALGFLGLAICVAGAVVAWNRGPGFGPHWFHFGLIASTLPSAWLGGRLQLTRSANPAV